MINKIEAELLKQLKEDLEGICAITIFGVGRFPSPTTYQLLHIAIEKYKNLSWEPLVILDDGIVFIGDIKTPLPTREEISEMTDLSIGTVKSRINRGRAHLQKLLKNIY